MLPKYESKLEKLNGILGEVTGLLDGLDKAALHHKPNGKWSPSQVFQHLHDSEKGTTAYLRKKLNAPPSEVPSGGISSFVRATFLSRALRNKTNKFQAPNVLADIVDKPDYPELRQSFFQTREEMRAVLDTVNKAKAGKAYFRHPRVGRITVGQTLDFLTVHLERHFEQIKERIQ